MIIVCGNQKLETKYNKYANMLAEAHFMVLWYFPNYSECVRSLRAFEGQPFSLLACTGIW